MKRRRLNRGDVQRLKAGVRAAMATLQVFDRANHDDGKWLLLEIFAGKALLTRCARQHADWRALEPIDLSAGWDLNKETDRKALLDLVDKEKPDLVTLAPPCGPWSSWTQMCRDVDALMERRRQHLPFWKLVGDIWQRQCAGGRLVLVEQPARSEALKLQYMLAREGVVKAVVAQCAFGLKDPENGKPHQKLTSLDVNCSVMAAQLPRQAYCSHAPGEHQPIEGSCRVNGQLVRRSEAAAAWPVKLCERILEAAGLSFRSRTVPTSSTSWSLVAEAGGGCWETVPVSSASLPEEALRQQMTENAITGDRYDYVTFDGEAAQQPRRLRAMVAHLHVTLGHLSNDRLARMFVLSGAQNNVVQLAKKLRCQVCAMVRPPAATPQVAYEKPKQFNERISGDSFYIWDAENKKFLVTHFIDGLTDYHVGELTDTAASGFAKEVLQDLWYAVFGPPDLLITDGGPEFQGAIQTLNDMFAVVHEVVPEGAKWRLGQVERHGSVAKLMMMRMVKEMDLKGLEEMRRAALAAFAAKNRTFNRGGVSPMQAVTGRNNMLPASLMEQLSSGRVRFRYNDELSHNDALARAERIRAGAISAFHWLDAHTALRKALASRSRPPNLEAIQEGTVVYVYEDNSSWTGPGVVVCERDHSVPRRLWVRIWGRVKAFPLEKVRLATPDEMTSSQFITDALKDVEAELTKGNLITEEAVGPGPSDAAAPEPLQAGTPKRRKVVVDFEEESDHPEHSGEESSSSDDEEDAEDRANRAKLLEDVPYSIQRNLAERRKREEEQGLDPHALEFAKKQKMFEALSKTFGAPTKLQEGELRNRMEQAYAKVRSVRKVIRRKGKDEQPKKGRQARGRDGAGASQAATVDVLAAAGDVLVPYFKPGEFEAMVNDTIGQWTLWTGTSRWAGVSEIYEVSATLHRAEMEGVTEVVTGRARAEYQWSKLDDQWRRSYIDPLKKAIGVYLEHQGIKGVPKGQMVDPARVLGSRFVLTNKGGPTLSEAELKARWIFGGHKDPDAGLYDTSSPTASILGHNLINFVAVQEKWVVHYEDVSAAFLQGKELPRKERIYVKVPRGYPAEVTDFLVSELGKDVRDDLVELTKGGFGLPESPRLWYLEYKDTIQDLGLYEMSLLPGVFRAFHPPPQRRVRALASIHVDDTRYAGDETAQEIWDKLRGRLKFGKQRKATDGWVKFCGRWERQDPETFEMEYSMEEYIKGIPLARTRASPSTSASTGSSSTASRTTPTTASVGSGLAATTSAFMGSSSTASRTTPTTASVGSDQEWLVDPIPQDSDLWDYLQDRVESLPTDVEPLTEAEKKVISSIVGQLNWAARQGRYDLAYVASLVQQLAGRGRPEALRWLNLGVKRAQEPRS